MKRLVKKDELLERQKRELTFIKTCISQVALRGRPALSHSVVMDLYHLFTEEDRRKESEDAQDRSLQGLPEGGDLQEAPQDAESES